MSERFPPMPRISREEARAASAVARAIATLDPAGLAEAKAVLGAGVMLHGRGVRVEEPVLGESLGLAIAVEGAHLVLSLAPGIARVIADRVVGGTGEDVALGPTPLSRGEAGLVGYVVARALARAGSPASLLDAGLARSLAPGRRIVASFEIAIGEARGQGALIAPITARLPSPPPRLDPTLPVRASLVIGDARLSARDLRAIVAGDVLIPDALTLDPRVAEQGRARLVVGRSARVFEVERVPSGWRVALNAGIAAPRAPSRSWKRRRETPMSQPDTDTLQSISDVDVELSIELARLEMPVTEVATLAPGVVVQTGRLVGERVAVRAGERVIAWGELVDVEGEVGVRLTEVAGAST